MPAHLLSEDNLVIVTLQPNLAEPELTKVDAALETSLPVIVLGTKRHTIIGFVRTTKSPTVFQQVYLMLGPEVNSLCIFLAAPLAIFAASYITDIEPSGPQNRERNDPKPYPLHLLI